MYRIVKLIIQTSVPYNFYPFLNYLCKSASFAKKLKTFLISNTEYIWRFSQQLEYSTEPFRIFLMNFFTQACLLKVDHRKVSVASGILLCKPYISQRCAQCSVKFVTNCSKSNVFVMFMNMYTFWLKNYMYVCWVVVFIQLTLELPPPKNCW